MRRKFSEEREKLPVSVKVQTAEEFRVEIPVLVKEIHGSFVTLRVDGKDVDVSQGGYLTITFDPDLLR